MRRLLLLLATLALLAGCGEDEDTTTGPPTDPLGAVKGAWSGILSQRDTKPFPVEVTIASSTEPDENVVRYGGSIDCSGTWRYLGVDGDEVSFEEVIDGGGGGACKGRGTVTITPSGEDLDYRFVGGGVESRGGLRPAG